MYRVRFFWYIKWFYPNVSWHKQEKNYSDKHVRKSPSSSRIPSLIRFIKDQFLISHKSYQVEPVLNKNEVCYFASFCWTSGSCMFVVEWMGKDLLLNTEFCKTKCSDRLHVHHPATLPFIKDSSESPLRLFWCLEMWKMLLTLSSLSEGTVRHHICPNVSSILPTF